MKKQIQHFVFLLFITTSALFCLKGYSASDPLTRMTVLSIRSDDFSREEMEEIRKATGLAVGNVIDLKKVDIGIRALATSGRYLRIGLAVEPSSSGIEINIRGARLRRIRRLSFKGGDEAVVEEARSRLAMQEGSATDFRALEGLKETIQSIYQGRGYYLTEVMLVTKRVPDTDDIDVELAIVPNAPTVIGKIQVLGGIAEENEMFLGIISLKRGSRLTNAALEESREAITKYFVSNQYPTSRVEEVAVNFGENKLSADVTIRVKMGDRFQFVFDGNTQFSDVGLREFITTDLISQVDFGRIIADEIRRKYQAAGFHFCIVSYEITKDPATRVNQVRFRIQEGERVRIDRVDVNGGEPLGDGEIRSLLFSEAPGVLSRRLYWEAGTTEMIQRLEKRLRRMGFLNPSVTGPRTVFSEDRKGVILIIDARLGVQSKIGKIRFSGNSAFKSEVLEELTGLESNTPVNVEEINQSRKGIIEEYRRAGYADVIVNEGAGLIELTADQREATIHYDIAEGRKYHVGEVTIEGLRKTEPRVVLRELTLKKGDIYSEYEVNRSQENLYLLSLFSRVEILTETSPGDPGVKNVRVVVVELRPGNGEVGMGGAYEDPRIRWINFLSLAYKNIGGLNHTASSRAELRVPFSHKGNKPIPFLEYGVVLGYRAPYPFEIPVVFGAQAGLDGYEISTNSDGTISKLQYRARIEEKLEKRLGSHVTALYRLHRLERTTSETMAFIPVATPVPAPETDNIGSTGPGVILDFRDDIFNPTKGTYHTIDVEFAHPYLLSDENVFFMMTSLRNSFYFPLFSPFSFAMYAGATYATSFNRQSDLSLSDQAIPTARLNNELSLGGLSSIRGFSPKKVTPKTDAAEVLLYNARFEVSAVVVENLSAAVFFDTGQVFSAVAGEPLRLEATGDQNGNIYGKRYDGIGVGLRYKTPVGPVLIDIAQGLGAEKEFVKFSFTVGRF